MDYSKCRDFLTPKPSKNNLGFRASPAGYLPFDIADDGSISPHGDVIRSEKSKDGRSHFISFEIRDDYAYLSKTDTDSEKRTNPHRVPMRKVTVEIERDDQGHISKIITDNKLNKTELQKIQDNLTKHQLANMNEHQLKNMENFLQDEEYQAPFYQRTGANVSLRVQNGECVPIEQEERFLTEPKPEGLTKKRKLYNTELCHDIDEFLKEHPETAACFNPELNSKMAKIFKDYYPRPEMNEFGGGMYGPGVGGHGPGHSNDLESKLGSHSLRGKNSKMNQQLDIAIGRSPVISSQMILQDCYNMGLGSFIDDPTLWEAAGAVSNSGNSSEEVPAVAR